MEKPSWRLRILGDFVLERDGEVVDRFGVRREEALLAYLAIDPTTAKVRDQIGADLWPGVERRPGLKNISYNMFVIKKRLAEHGLLDPFEEVGNSSLRLNGEIQVDAQEFVEALAAGVSQTGQLGQVRRGLALYGGGLLPTYDESWVTPHQARFEELYQLAIQHMSEVVAPSGVQEAILRKVPTTAWRGGPFVPEVVGPDVPTREIQEEHNLVAFTREAEVGLEGEESATWVERVDELYPVIVSFFEKAMAAESTREALEVAVRLWRYWYIKGETPEGRRWMERLFQMRRSGSPLRRARAFHALGCMASTERDAPAAIDHFGSAIELWRKLDRPEQLVRSLNSLGMAHQNNDEMDQAAEKYDQAIAMAEALGEEKVLATALYNRAQIAINAQDFRRARRLLERRLDVLVPGNLAERVKTLAHMASSALGEDDEELAAEWGEEAARILPDDSAPDLQVQVHQVLGQLDHRRARYSEAITHFQRALEAARESRRMYLVGTAMAYKAFALRAQGEEGEAVDLYETAQNVLEGTGSGTLLKRFDAEWAAGA